ARKGQRAVVLGRQWPDGLLTDLLQTLEQRQLLAVEEPLGLEHRVEPGHGRLRSDRCHSGLLSLVLPAVGAWNCPGYSTPPPHSPLCQRRHLFAGAPLSPDTAMPADASLSLRREAEDTILVCAFLTHLWCPPTHPIGRSRVATCTGSSTRSARRSISTACFARSSTS